MEKTLTATGHRPQRMGGITDSLGGYIRDAAEVIQLRNELLVLLEERIAAGFSRFRSGGALGFDTLFYFCVHSLKTKYPHIRNYVDVPFPSQDKSWSANQRAWYRKMLKLSDGVTDVSSMEGYESKTFSERMKKRNCYMVDHAHEVVAFMTDPYSGTGHAVRYAATKNVPVFHIGKSL